MLAGNVHRLKADGTAGETLFPPADPRQDVQDRQRRGSAEKIGVIGALTPQIMNWGQDKLTGKLTTGDGSRRSNAKSQAHEQAAPPAHAGISAQPRQGMDENFAYHLSRRFRASMRW